MAQRSKIKQLPAAVREWLDGSLAAKNFSGYEQLEAELKARGYTIGKSSIHRYGANLEKKLSAIKASTEAARLIANSAPDDADQRSAAVMSLIQTEVFEVLVALQDLDGADPMQRAKLLSAVAKNMAALSRASIGQKKHELEVRARLSATVDDLAKAQGMSEDQAAFWRKKFLGVAEPKGA